MFDILLKLSIINFLFLVFVLFCKGLGYISYLFDEYSIRQGKYHRVGGNLYIGTLEEKNKNREDLAKLLKKRRQQCLTQQTL